MSADEREWMRRLQAGDPEAFESVYRRHGGRVLGFAVRLCGTREDAEDLTQDVFLAAYRAQSGFGARSRLLTWLLGIAVRRWRDRQRENARRPTIALGHEEERVPVASAPARPEMAEQVVHSLVLGEALATLSPPFRAALLLVFSQGMTYREAAEALGEPVGTIKWRVSEATRRVRRHLESMETDGDGMQQTVGKSDRSPGRR